VDVNPAELSVIKTVDKPIATFGSIITFTVNVTNAGPSNATNVFVFDSLPSEISSITNTTTSGFFDGFGWDIPLIQPGESAILNITGTITSSNNFSNFAGFSSLEQQDTNFTDNDDFADVTVLIADLSLSKSVDFSFASINDVREYTITVSNAGPNTATNINVTDVVPSELSFVTNTTTSGFYDGVSWTFPSILSGEQETLTITGVVNSAVSFNNTAEIVSVDQFDPDSTPNNGILAEDDQDFAEITAEVADLTVTKIVDSPIATVGDTITFTIDVFNAGPDTATGIHLIDLVPSEIDSVTNTTTSGFYDGTSWDIPFILSANTATLTITGTINTTDSFNNTAFIAFTEQFDPTTNDLTDTANVTVTFLDLSLTKTVNQTSANVGDTIQFEINVTNAGPFNATNIDIQDVLPAEVSEVTHFTTDGTYGNPTWLISQLDVGQTATLTIDVDIISQNSFNNTATIISVDEFDTNLANDNQTVSVTVLLADLAISKTVDQSLVNYNDTVTFTVVLNNTGPDNATNIVVTDFIPFGL